MRIIWSPIAIDRVEEIFDFISLDSLRMAKKVVKSIFTAVEKLRKFPKIGRIVSESNRPDIREVIKLGFRIIYRLEKKQILILTVRHSRRKLAIGEVARARDIITTDDPIQGPIMH